MVDRLLQPNQRAVLLVLFAKPPDLLADRPWITRPGSVAHAGYALGFHRLDKVRIRRDQALQIRDVILPKTQGAARRRWRVARTLIIGLRKGVSVIAHDGPMYTNQRPKARALNLSASVTFLLAQVSPYEVPSLGFWGPSLTLCGPPHTNSGTYFFPSLTRISNHRS